ncbi:PASTA domain-containing protein [Micromonospora sp. NPDC049559]|uniref:PASTA domain-containing protein n=1 Tax=Micromonospora sp. NPDC049559 TaxID=3155923 RepID=UPI003423538A
MTDEHTGWGTPPAGTSPSGPSRTALVAGALVGVVLLATIGAIGGWLIAESQNGTSPNALETGGPVLSPSTVATTKGTRTTPPAPTKTTPRLQSGQFLLPNLVGKDFEDAREELRDRKLGTHVVFGVAGQDRTVLSTDPAPNTPVSAGITVQIRVVGAAPVVAVPDLVGKDCDEAKDELDDEGLSPRYPTGQRGEVIRQEPEAKAEARWNDQVRVYCGTPGSPTP